MQRCLRWQVSRTRRAGEALLPRSPSAQRGAERRSRRHSALEEVRTRRVAAGKRCGLFSGQHRASDALRRLLEVVPRGLRRLWDGAPCPITLAQFPARHHLAGKIRFRHPALYYNYPLFTGVMHLLGARLLSCGAWAKISRFSPHFFGNSSSSLFYAHSCI